MTARLRSSALIALALLVEVACKKPEIPPPPPVSTVIYDVQKDLGFNAITQSHSVYFAGTGNYTIQGESPCSRAVKFIFDDNSQMDVDIIYSDGVIPGQTLTYGLAHNRTSVLDSWPMVLSNPPSASKRQYNYHFVINTKPTSGQLLWVQKGDPVEGSYILSGSSGGMAVSIKFHAQAQTTGTVLQDCGGS